MVINRTETQFKPTNKINIFYKAKVQGIKCSLKHNISNKFFLFSKRPNKLWFDEAY